MDPFLPEKVGIKGSLVPGLYLQRLGLPAFSPSAALPTSHQKGESTLQYSSDQCRRARLCPLQMGLDSPRRGGLVLSQAGHTGSKLVPCLQTQTHTLLRIRLAKWPPILACFRSSSSLPLCHPVSRSAPLHKAECLRQGCQSSPRGPPPKTRGQNTALSLALWICW